MFFINVFHNLVEKKKFIKPCGKRKKTLHGKNLSMKKLSHDFTEKISRKNFFEKSLFFFSGIGFNFIFENNNIVLAENLEKNFNTFSTKSGLKIIDFLPGETQTPQWGDFLIIDYVMYKSSSQKIEKISDTYQKKNSFSIYSRWRTDDQRTRRSCSQYEKRGKTKGNNTRRVRL
mmetsp:Transcript_15342/g.39044  ORF Transcript_15342/g.39044 Transcript_15342/m.39044 type:complete len:174 (-) Transcript_15342:298-819(-)